MSKSRDNKKRKIKAAKRMFRFHVNSIVTQAFEVSGVNNFFRAAGIDVDAVHAERNRRRV